MVFARIFAQICVILSILLHRSLMLSLPYFKIPVTEHPLENILSGVLSDASVAIGLVGAIQLCAHLFRTSRLRWLMDFFFIVFALLVNIGLTCHLHYVEFFGLTLRPFHLMLAHVKDFWTVGPGMVTASWKSIVLLVVPWSLALLFGRLLTMRKRSVSFENNCRQISKQKYLVYGVFLILGIIFSEALSSMLAVLPNVNPELRYNPIKSFYENLVEFRRYQNLPRPNKDDVEKMREFFAVSGRHYEKDLLEDRYPFWQTAVPSINTASNEIERTLKDFLDEEAGKKGPWNILLILSESLRAHEITAFGNHEELYRTLTPAMTKIASKSIRFEETYHVGEATKFGQTATLCSYLDLQNYPLMIVDPTISLVCLPDIAKEKLYFTYFFYAGDNQFDNQDLFYRSHHIDKILGREAFPPSKEIGKWGASDHELFEKSLSLLKDAPKPFFGTILTVTNHEPHVLPMDAPSTIRRDLPILDQMLQYVDWSTGDFLEKFSKKFPHTIIILTADHGSSRKEPFSKGQVSPAFIRRMARIPLLIYVPGMPSSLQGVSLRHLTSQVDIAPTLLTLLGWGNTPQQFSGVDAFSRTTEPIFVDWFADLFKAAKKKVDSTDVEITPVPQRMIDLITSLIVHKMLAPAPLNGWKLTKE